MLRTLIVLLRFYIRLQRYNNKARIAKKNLRVENIRSCQGLGELETLGQLEKLGKLGELGKLGKLGKLETLEFLVPLVPLVLPSLHSPPNGGAGGGVRFSMLLQQTFAKNGFLYIAFVVEDEAGNDGTEQRRRRHFNTVGRLQSIENALQIGIDIDSGKA